MTDIKPHLIITDLPSPAPDNPLEALEWLGSTVEEVAEGLRARGIKAKKGLASNSCPLAVYLQTWWPTATVAIGGWAVWNDPDNGTVFSHGKSPSACYEFETMFDEFLFPDLEA